MTHDREAHWQSYYRALHEEGGEWLDYASSAEQIFTFGACLLVAGDITGKRCLDAGCGKGKLAKALKGLGAGEVVGVDMVASTIESLRASDAGVRWEAGRMDDPALLAALGRFHTIFAVELLQYLTWADALANFWRQLLPGGRIVGVVPNGDNPFVKATIERFAGHYDAPPAAELCATLRTLREVATWGIAGMAWREDRSVLLYDLSPMGQECTWPSAPKRLLFAARKAG